MTDRKLPDGWWIAPGAVLGAIVWVGIIAAIYAVVPDRPPQPAAQTEGTER